MATKVTYNGPEGMVVAGLGQLIPGRIYDVEDAEMAKSLLAMRWFERPSVKAKRRRSVRSTARRGEVTGAAVDRVRGEVTRVDMGPPRSAGQVPVAPTETGLDRETGSIEEAGS